MNITPKLRGFLAFCLILLLVGCGLSESRIRREKESEARHKLGIANLNSSAPNVQKAYIEFLEAVKINPENKDAHYALGHVYAQREDYPKAILEFQATIAIAPNYSEAHNYLGNIYETLGKDAEAILSYQEALKNLQYETPQFPHWHLGLIYVRQNQLEKARASFKEAVAVAPSDHMAHYLLASFYFQKGPRELASNEFKKVIALAPQSPEAENAKKNLESLK